MQSNILLEKMATTAILLQENKFFILDEPFNGVDIQSNIIITELILKLKELGKTISISYFLNVK
jgi:ABC-2 type transport system ATP-binding protein